MHLQVFSRSNKHRGLASRNDRATVEQRYSHSSDGRIKRHTTARMQFSIPRNARRTIARSLSQWSSRFSSRFARGYVTIACPFGIEITKTSRLSRTCHRGKTTRGNTREALRTIYREAAYNTTACTSLTLLNADSFTLNRAASAYARNASKAEGGGLTHGPSPIVGAPLEGAKGRRDEREETPARSPSPIPKNQCQRRFCEVCHRGTMCTVAVFARSGGACPLIARLVTYVACVEL